MDAGLTMSEAMVELTKAEATNVATAKAEIAAELQVLIAAMKNDLGLGGIAAGSRELGHAENPKPLIPHDEE
jgi:hypothetical protein